MADEPPSLWLTDEQSVEWQILNRGAAGGVFGAFLSAWAIQVTASRLLNKRKAVTGAPAQARLQHGAVSLAHALVCLCGALYAALLRDLSPCEGRLFCVDTASARIQDAHAGFRIFEMLWVANNAGLYAAWPYPMIFLHHGIHLALFVLTKIYPCKLTLLLLPWWEVAELSAAAGALESLALAFRASIGANFNALLAVMAALGARTLGATALALYVWTWIRGAGLWTLVLPHGQDVMNIPYGVLALAGSLLLALVSYSWFVEALGRANKLLAAAEKSPAGRAAVAGKSGEPAAPKAGKGKAAAAAGGAARKRR